MGNLTSIHCPACAVKFTRYATQLQYLLEKEGQEGKTLQHFPESDGGLLLSMKLTDCMTLQERAAALFPV